MTITRDAFVHQREIAGRIDEKVLLRLAAERIAAQAGIDLDAPGVLVESRLSAQGIGGLGPTTHDAVVQITVQLGGTPEVGS